ncbi:putative PDDEXK endonuclease [Corynebacterium macginleyi]|uniref:putative PDDEXK endonuclease n=1 Tax=Corynebacterium macginleyi TaxID=38290 RepID=UPI00308040E0
MSRTRKSAKQAGARFERIIADFLRDNLDDRIDRRVKVGAADKGDIANVRDSHNRRITIECKDYGGKLNLPQWTKEAHQEANNDNAHVGVVIAKRRGTTDPEKQWAIMEVEDLIKLLKSPGNVL